MTKTFRHWTTGMVMAVSLMTVTQTAFADQPTNALTIRLLVLNEAGVPPEILERAKTEMTRIYAMKGLEVEWTDAAPADAPSLHFTMKIVSHSLVGSERAATDVMGVALREARGRLAYTFYGRVETCARKNQIELSQMLAHVIAHEIGHLLLPSHSHSHTGLMRGTWDRSQISEAVKGQLTFTEEQIRSIRSRAGETRAN